MRLAKVVGTLVATQKHPSIKNSKILLIQPLTDELKEIGDIIAAIDVAQAGVNDLVYYTLSREAALALPNSFAPVDAVITGIVDQINNNEDKGIVNKEQIFMREET